jgi:hypothetical protein
MTLDDVLFILIGSGMALSAVDLYYRLHLQAKDKKSAHRLEPSVKPAMTRDSPPA